MVSDHPHPTTIFVTPPFPISPDNHTNAPNHSFHTIPHCVELVPIPTHIGFRTLPSLPIILLLIVPKFSHPCLIRFRLRPITCVHTAVQQEYHSREPESFDRTEQQMLMLGVVVVVLTLCRLGWSPTPLVVR